MKQLNSSTHIHVYLLLRSLTKTDLSDFFIKNARSVSGSVRSWGAGGGGGHLATVNK